MNGEAGQGWEREPEKACLHGHGGPGLKHVQWVTGPANSKNGVCCLCVCMTQTLGSLHILLCKLNNIYYFISFIIS